MSALWTPGRAGTSPGFLVAQPGASVTGPPPARCLRGVRRSWFDAGSAPSRSTPRGSGSTDHGLCVLHEGPTYPQYPQPSSSSTPPSCSASRRHRQPPQSPGRPPPTSRSSSSPIRQTHPTSVSDVMTSETLRSHETTQGVQGTNARATLRTRGARSRGDSEAMVQRPAPDPDPFPPRVDQCARGWGSTGRGMCVLHEPPTPMEYTRRSCSGAPPSCSVCRTRPGSQRGHGGVLP